MMEEFVDYFKQKKNLLNLLVLGILVLALPLGINLIRQQQILKSRAAVEPIVFTGDNVQKKVDGTWVATKPQITLNLTSPLESQAGGNPTSPPVTTPLSSTIPLSSNVYPDYNNFNVGFNVTGITHYGFNDLLIYSSAADVEADLNEINRMGGKIIRVFVANDQISADEAARRLDAFLTKAASKNISVIASLINFYGNGFRPQGTEQYYTDIWNGIPLLNHDFFAGGYQGSYLPFVKTVVSYNKNHSNIYAWEPGNELKDNNSPQTFISFMQDVTRTIKAEDLNHLVATGMLNAAHASLSPDELYSALPDVDIITVHDYTGVHDGLADVQWALSHGKKAINEEMGLEGTGDRSGAVRQELDFWKSQVVIAVLQWGLIAKGLSDNGDGDRTYGMDAIWHTDYDQLADIFSSFN